MRFSIQFDTAILQESQTCLKLEPCPSVQDRSKQTVYCSPNLYFSFAAMWKNLYSSQFMDFSLLLSFPIFSHDIALIYTGTLVKDVLFYFHSFQPLCCVIKCALHELKTSNTIFPLHVLSREFPNKTKSAKNNNVCISVQVCTRMQKRLTHQ